MRALYLLLPLLIFACSPGKKLQRAIENAPVFDRSQSGFILLDPSDSRVLCALHADKLFTPASNTKIFTLYTCLQLLGDSLPALQYQSQPKGIGILFRATGDPTFLHPRFQAWQSVYTFLNRQPSLQFTSIPFAEKRLGPGWAWDDYNDAYSAERSPMPIYGNTVSLQKLQGAWLVEPPYFHSFLTATDNNDTLDTEIVRQEQGDSILLPYWHQALFPDSFEVAIPIYQSAAKWQHLLEDTLHQSIYPVSGSISGNWKTIYSTPADTVYRRMMHQSDNFIAEQLLLTSAGQKLGIFSQDSLIRWMLHNKLSDLPQTPRWVDGSGLSRYNLFSPQDMALVLQKLWKAQPQKRLFDLFPAGGVSGTVTNWYKGADGKPYVYAKTGSMSGVHCLSGYIVTKRGKVLIFSFMHNNFTGSNKDWKLEMQQLLESIRNSNF